MSKEIIRIMLPNDCLGIKIPQANTNDKYSYRIQFPQESALKNHSILVSEDFVHKFPDDDKHFGIFLYADNKQCLSKLRYIKGNKIYNKVYMMPDEILKTLGNEYDLKQKQSRVQWKKGYTQEQIEEIKSNVNIMEFLQAHTCFTFTPQGKYFQCDQHDSLIIKGTENIFFWNSMHVSGNVIDYLMKVDGMNFNDAMDLLMEYYNGLPIEKRNADFKKEYASRKVEFKLPEKKSTCRSVIKYLCEERGIRKDVLYPLINEGRIYQDKRGNAVFVCKNNKNEDVGAFVRSTYSQYKGDVAGSQKTWGMFLHIYPKAKKLVITEAFIDGLSYLSYKLNNGEVIDFNILMSDSASVLFETFKINYLTRKEINEYIDTVILAPDHDTAGLKAIEPFKESGKFFNRIKDFVVDIPELEGYDWNEKLIEQKNNMSKDFSKMYGPELK